MPITDAATRVYSSIPSFEHLPAYARYLLDNKLAEFSAAMLQISRNLEIPLLRYFEHMPEEELIALTQAGNTRLLSALAANDVTDYLETSLRSWRDNQLPIIQGDDIVIEDISKANFARRKGFRKFLPGYSNDPAVFIAIMEEVDQFTVIQEEVNYKTLFELKEAKIREHHHFIEKINNASPGINYVYDLVSNKLIYSNHRREEMLGYSNEEYGTMDEAQRNAFVHPDDRAIVKAHREAFFDASDTELRTIEFRLRNKFGKYVWQRSYESVFRRSEDGRPAEVIGVAIDVSEEKEANSRLEQREQQLREAQEIAGMGSFDWDLQGQNSSFSEQLLHIFELGERSNLPDFLEFVHPADRESVKKAIADAINGTSVYECEYRYRKNGPEKVIWSRGKVVYENSRPCRMKGTVMDVTQRHDMLKRLARSEQLHKQAQALTHLGNWSWSLLDDKVDWSDEMYRIFGLPPQSEMMNFDRIATFIHPDDREYLRQALIHALDTGVAEDYTMRLLTGADGAVKYVEGKTEVLCDEHGKPYKIAGTCQDITAHHLLTEQLRENEEASTVLINNAPEAIVVIDVDSRVLVWNPKAEAVFGWQFEEISGKTLMDTIIPAQYRSMHDAGIRRMPTNESSKVLNQTIEIEALKKSGEPFYIALNISRSQRGGKVVYIAFIRDISDERATAQKLEEQRHQLALQNRALERSNQELTAFNYISSHDLKEPVRKIKIFGNLIATNEAEPLTPHQQDTMSRILASASHMERLIEALTVFSRTTTSERRFEYISLGGILEEVKLLLKERIEEENATVTVDHLPHIWAIPFQIQQLFENLLSNALKYRKPDMPPVVHITATEISGDSITEVGAVPEGRYHRISISDNGIGFEQQYAAKVFEVFQRLHAKESYSGTGIGLAICKKIMQHHDGFISASSEPGIGTRFDVYLPVKKDL